MMEHGTGVVSSAPHTHLVQGHLGHLSCEVALAGVPEEACPHIQEPSAPCCWPSYPEASVLWAVISTHEQTKSKLHVRYVSSDVTVWETN
jgi:hypothetical protein